VLSHASSLSGDGPRSLTALASIHSGANVRFDRNRSSRGEDDITTALRSSFECVDGEPRTSEQVEALRTYDIPGRVCRSEPFVLSRCPCGVSKPLLYSL
jgi:hypothetical protein